MAFPNAARPDIVATGRRPFGAALLRYVLSLAVLCVFALTLTAPAVAAVSGPAEHDASSDWHADGTPCPDDEDSDHGPCDDGCPCRCCHHGHVLALWLSAPTFEGMVPTSPAIPSGGPSQDMGPNGYLDRIYRPPRG